MIKDELNWCVTECRDCQHFKEDWYMIASRRYQDDMCNHEDKKERVNTLSGIPKNCPMRGKKVILTWPEKLPDER